MELRAYVRRQQDGDPDLQYNGLCSVRLGHWDRLRALISRADKALDGSTPEDPKDRLSYIEHTPAQANGTAFHLL